MSEWKSLGEVCDFSKDKVAVSVLDLENYISTENLLPNKGGVTEAASLPKIVTTTSFNVGDILISNIRPYFKKIWRAKFSGGCSNDVLVIRAKKNVEPRFLYYVLSEDKFFDLVTATAKGTKMPRGDKQVIMNYPVPDFPLETQKKIAAVLSALDDKIELNNAINKNLEEQAQAIFDEFYRKADEEVFLGKTCKCELGGTPSRKNLEYWNGNISWINSGEVNKFRIIEPSEKITELGLKKSATKLLPAKTTVIAITGATLGQVSLLEIESCANQSVVGIIPNKKIPYEYIYPLVKMKISELLTHQTGGAQQHINKRNVEDLSIKILSPNFMKKYLSIVSGIYELISNICFENQKLGELRDALLPKLMSGEIDVSAVEI